MTQATVCLIVKDEAPYLIEWLSHYLSLGFDRIVVYDNASSDATAHVVRTCANVEARIRLVDWPDRPGQVAQFAAYSHALAHADTEWIAFFDADEFLVLHDHASIQDFLVRYDEGVGAIAINWLLFGSAGEMDFRDDWQASRFRMCASNDHRNSKNCIYKTIARTRSAGAPVAHGVTLIHGAYHDDRGEKISAIGEARTPVVSHRYAQLNHYVLRSAREYEDKRRRGTPARAPGAPDKFAYRNAEFWREHDTNQRRDDTIDPWLVRAEPIRARFQDLLQAQRTLPYSRHVPLPAGWYLVQGKVAAGAEDCVLRVVFAGSLTHRQLALAPRKEGTLRQLFLLEHDIAHWSVDAGAVSLRRVGRLHAAAFMLGNLRGLRRRCRAVGEMVPALLRGRVGSAGVALHSTYVAGLFNSVPLLLYRLRRQWWLPGRAQATTLDQLRPFRTVRKLVAWEATGGDPKIVLWADSTDALSKGWYRLRGRFETLDGRISAPCLYMDYGAGFSADEASHFPQPGADDKFDALVLLKFPVVGLRFDPTTRPATFALSELALERVSRAGALLRMLLAFRSPDGRLDVHASVLAARRFAVHGLSGGISAAAQDLHQRYLTHRRSDPKDYASWVREHDTLNERDLRALRETALAHAGGPLISILLPVYAPPERWLRRCIDSVREQAYPKWELCIAEDASPSQRTRKLLAEYQRLDPRIKVVYRASNGHISAASNTALEMATGEYVALLDHDDELRPHSLLEVVRALDARPDLGLVYSDEDKIDQDGRRFDPYFKPDWNPELLRGQNYICHFTVLRTSLVREVGGFRQGFEGSQDHDLFLRCTERLQAPQIHHIPHILYHWRAIPGSTAMGHDAKDYAARAGVRAVAEHLLRTGIDGEAIQLPHGHYQVRREIRGNPPLVSIVIPTRDQVQLLRTCIESILERSRYPAFEIMVVDNRSADPETLAYLQQLQTHERVQVLRYDHPFNYSAINNFAVEHCRGELVCLLNNDIEVISPDWLQELAALALQSDVGAVGAMLYYPDDTIQHAGVMLGIGGVANHPYCGKPRGYPGHGGRVKVAQYLSAVTGACLMVRKQVYQEAGGLDEELQVAFNDIDFCLKLLAKGYRNAWTPFAELYHHESASRGRDDTPEKIARFHREVALMLARWQPSIDGDPAYNPNLSVASLDFELAFPPRHVETGWYH